MSRRVSNPPQTPLSSEDALERSLRRQRGSSRQRESLADVARRVNESPISTPLSASGSRRSSGRALGNDSSSASPSLQVSPGDFQEWMKMVRLKRVKANNAFTIQLIDCFHSMVKGASFQEATHTLGGCLTVYKNRIASVKDDTSKLLVGVSEKKAGEAAHARHEDSIAGSDVSDEEDSDSNRRRVRKQRRRMPSGAEAYLVPGEKLEIDTNELATTIDPLLRKMSADFDKRGAGALLQYSLKPDASGRLLLDADAPETPKQLPSSLRGRAAATSAASRTLPVITEDDQEGSDEDRSEQAVMTTAVSDPADEEDARTQSHFEQTEHADLAHFNVAFIASVELGACEAVPNVEGIVTAVRNPEEGTEALVRSMQAWANADPSDASIYSAGQDHDNDDVGESLEKRSPITPTAFETAPELGLGFDVGDDMDWDAQNDVFEGVDQEGHAAHAEDGETSIASVRAPPDGNWLDVGFLKRVDAQQSNWAGPSFWKIRRLRARDALEVQANGEAGLSGREKPVATTRRGVKPPAVIDFMSPSDVDVEELFTPGKGAIYLPARQLDETDKHLLPVDMRVTTAQLVNLSLRPDTGVAPAFMREAWSVGDVTGEVSFADESGAGPGGNFGDGSNMQAEGGDDGFFYGGWDDVDAEPVLNERPQTASAMFSQTQPTQPIYESQRHQLNFARTAKHVDVRKLKDNVWKAISHDAEAAKDHGTTLLNVIHETRPQYSEQQRADLSPAMYFISLLHLSNEKGMRLENVEGLTDVRILADELSS